MSMRRGLTRHLIWRTVAGRVIQISDLPVAFREAISFARGLAINYLWIDSLYIVQSGDGGEDWQVECGRMQDVYENCILNISVAHGETPLQSYLEQPTNGVFYPFDLDGQYLVAEENFIDNHLIRLPLNSRAWVLQEQFFSPRVLGFSHGQIFWDCIELGNAFESFPGGLVNLKWRERLRAHPGKGLQEQHVFWKTMIERYTERQLTFFEKDRLLAFSAIAKRMATTSESTYIAGHSWNQLPQSLTWQVIKSPARCPVRKNTYMCEDGRLIKTPSWSWASMDSQIAMPIMSTLQPIAYMRNFSLDLVDQANPYGQVVSASLDLRAYCAEIKCTGGFPTISDHSITLNDSTSWNGYDISSWWIIDDPQDDLHEGDRCKIVALSKAESTKSVYGLIVKEFQGPEMNVCRRIGYYCIKSPITVWQSMESWHSEKKMIVLV